jgi:hypothetical protein
LKKHGNVTDNLKKKEKTEPEPQIVTKKKQTDILTINKIDKKRYRISI